VAEFDDNAEVIGMSMGPMGMAGSIAGGVPQARGADSDRIKQQSNEQARQAESDQKAESASGVGETEQDEQASDRDADGRRLWEGSEEEKTEEGEASTDEATRTGGNQPQSKDPTGMSGENLDLSG